MVINMFILNQKHYRRGLATVVTSAILLSATSIMGVMLLGWSQTSFSAQQQEMEDTYNTQINKINEDLVFDNVWFSATCPGNCVNITMSNVGILGLNVTQMRFDDGATLETLVNFYYTDAGIVPSETFSTNATYAWTTGQDIDIIVFTDRGNQFRTQEIVP